MNDIVIFNGVEYFFKEIKFYVGFYRENIKVLLYKK